MHALDILSKTQQSRSEGDASQASTYLCTPVALRDMDRDGGEEATRNTANRAPLHLTMGLDDQSTA
jgi:hypothetical protein